MGFLKCMPATMPLAAEEEEEMIRRTLPQMSSSELKCRSDRRQLSLRGWGWGWGRGRVAERRQICCFAG